MKRNWFRIPREIVLRLIEFYQKLGRLRKRFWKYLFLTDSICRFSPTCSEYSHQAIQKFGLISGSSLTVRRVLRCHPWSGGGLDPVPQNV